MILRVRGDPSVFSGASKLESCNIFVWLTFVLATWAWWVLPAGKRFRSFFLQDRNSHKCTFYCSWKVNRRLSGDSWPFDASFLGWKTRPAETMGFCNDHQKYGKKRQIKSWFLRIVERVGYPLEPVLARFDKCTFYCIFFFLFLCFCRGSWPWCLTTGQICQSLLFTLPDPFCVDGAPVGSSGYFKWKRTDWLLSAWGKCSNDCVCVPCQSVLISFTVHSHCSLLSYRFEFTLFCFRSFSRT